MSPALKKKITVKIKEIPIAVHEGAQRKGAKPHEATAIFIVGLLRVASSSLRVASCSLRELLVDQPPTGRVALAAFSRASTASQSMLEKNASIYFGRSAGL